jgi:enolase
VFHTLKGILHKKNLSTSVGDEGGFAPSLSGEEEALEILLEAIYKAGFVPGKDFMLALDAASTEMFEEAKSAGKEGSYLFWNSLLGGSYGEISDHLLRGRPRRGGLGRLETAT